jgi:F0F1-type ATP synthase epsilon subunit
LDRFYLSDYFTIKEGEVGILAGTTIPNHAPIILDIKGGERNIKSSYGFQNLCLRTHKSN